MEEVTMRRLALAAILVIAIFVASAASPSGRAGRIKEFPVPTAGSAPGDITAGPDGNMWFTESVGNNIGRINPTGVVTEFPVPTPSSYPAGIARGPDGNLWFTENDANQIGRLTPAG